MSDLFIELALSGEVINLTKDAQKFLNQGGRLSLMKGKTKYVCRAIIEIAGKPKDHIKQTMKLVMKKLAEEEGTKIIHFKTHEPAEHEGGVFNTFTEVEIGFADFEHVFNFCFEYLPSSIEFVEPENPGIDLMKLSHLFSELIGRLHNIDVRLKDAAASIIVLDKNANNLLKIILYNNLKQGNKNVEDLAIACGIPIPQLEPFLDKYVKEGTFKKSGEQYSL